VVVYADFWANRRTRRDFPGSDVILLYVMWPSPPAGRCRLAIPATFMLPSTTDTDSAPATFTDNLVAHHSHTPHNRCLRFGRSVTSCARKTRSRPARYALAGRDFHPQDDASFARRTPGCSGIRSLTGCPLKLGWIKFSLGMTDNHVVSNCN